METTVNERIREVRNYLGMTQEDFSHRLGTTLTTISRTETGGSNPRLSLLNAIIEQFMVRREWLLTGSGEMLLPGKAQMEPTEGISWKEEAFTAMKSHNETLMQEVQWLRQLVNSLTGKGQPDFLNTTGLAGVSLAANLASGMRAVA